MKDFQDTTQQTYLKYNPLWKFNFEIIRELTIRTRIRGIFIKNKSKGFTTFTFFMITTTNSEDHGISHYCREIRLGLLNESSTTVHPQLQVEFLYPLCARRRYIVVMHVKLSG